MSEGSPTVRRRRLGLILRDLREQTGKTGDEVGEALERSASWVSRIEIGKQGMRVRDLRELLDLYQVTDAELRTELEDLAREGKARAWWNKYGEAITGSYAAFIGFEAEAEEILNYETLVVPGLLQTEDYARALFSDLVPPDSIELIERKTRVRIARQQLLVKEKPLRLWAILDESILHRRIGNADIMREQLKRLADAAIMSNVTLQIVPFTAGAFPGSLHSFTLIRFDQPARDPEIAYMEQWSGGVFAEGDEVERYHQVFNHLRAAALSPSETLDRIREAIDSVA